MKKLIVVFLIFISAGIAFASFADETKERAIKLCTNLNMNYISHAEDQNTFIFTTFNVKCGQDAQERAFILKYEKLLGTWSQHNFVK
jgi:hypothetical protein